MPARKPRNRHGGECRTVGEGLIVFLDVRRQQVQQAVDVEGLVNVVHSQILRRLGRRGTFVEFRLPKRNRECARVSDASRLHSGDDQRAVDSTGKKRPQRNIAHQARLDCIFDQRIELLHEVALRALVHSRIRTDGTKVPIALDARAPGVYRDEMTGRELVHVPMKGKRSGDIAEFKIHPQGIRIELEAGIAQRCHQCTRA